MDLTLVYPRSPWPAIEERYASWQSEMLLRDALPQAAFRPYDPHHTAADAVHGITTEFTLIVVDPLLLAPELLLPGLTEALQAVADAQAAIPVSNEAEHAAQRAIAPEPYLTLRQFQDTAARLGRDHREAIAVEWDRSNPGLFLCRTKTMAAANVPPSQALAGRRVAVAPSVYVHRWISLRAQNRLDLLAMVSPEAHDILEFGCGEGLLGEAIKKRQKARVVGIELDDEAAARARKRIDEVFNGDVREIVGILNQRFDWIIGGDILEHLDEPWSFLTDLRRLTVPGGHLLLSIPNIANWAIAQDLLRGRFDYTYIGITCAGHLRFFTRRSIEEMLHIAGWSVESISSQAPILSSEAFDFRRRLDSAGIEYSWDDLSSPGWYVVARSETRRQRRGVV